MINKINKSLHLTFHEHIFHCLENIFIKSYMANILEYLLMRLIDYYFIFIYIHIYISKSQF